MKVFLLLALVAVAFCGPVDDFSVERYPEEVFEDSYSASDDEYPYDPRDDYLEPDETWITEDVEIDMTVVTPASAHLLAGPCSLHTHHEQIRASGEIYEPGVSLHVVFWPEEEREEVHTYDTFAEETRQVNDVTNIPKQVMDEIDDPVIFFQPDSGHEQRMGTCSQMDHETPYVWESRLRHNNGNGNKHRNKWHGSFKVGCSGQRKVNGQFKRTGNGYGFHWKGSCKTQGNKANGCHKPGNNRRESPMMEEFDIGYSKRTLLSDKPVSFDSNITSKYENAPFEIYVSYDLPEDYDASDELVMDYIPSTAPVENAAVSTSSTVSDPSTATLDKPTLYFDVRRHNNRRRGYKKGARKHRCRRKHKPPGQRG